MKHVNHLLQSKQMSDEKKSKRKCFCDKDATKHCGKCKAKWYCSADCQKKNWPEHKKTCKEPFHVVEIPPDDVKKMEGVLRVCYHVAKDGRKFIPAAANAPNAVLSNTIEWQSEEEQYKNWMSGP